MNIDRHVGDLQEQLAVAAAAGGDDVRNVAQRLALALDPAVRIMVLEVLSDAAAEISAGVAPASVEVRLRGREPQLVVSGAPVWGTPSASAGPGSADASAAPPPAASGPAPSVGDDVGDDEAGSSRTTLRLPDRLKSRVEQAASRDGVSVNAWLVRAATAALDPRAAARTGTSTASDGRSATGWFR